MLLISCFLSAQFNSYLRSDFPLQKEKISKISKKSTVLIELLESQSINQESILKGAAAKQKLDSTVTRVINSETQVWQNDNKDEFVYDSNLKNTAWFSKEWNLTSKKWEIWIKTELGYDNKNRVNSMLMYEKDSITQVLVASSKFLIFYNSEGMQDSTLTYFTEDGGVKWSLEMKQINYYNASKQLIKVDVWALDEEKGKLMLSMKVAYTYTAAGKIQTSTTNYIMEGEEITWSKIVYNYDGSNKLTSSENWQLNFMTFALEKTSRDSYQYNAVGDVSVEIYSTWNGTSWIEKEKDESTYSSTNFSDVVFPQFIGLLGIGESTEFNYNKAIAGTNTFEMSNGNWKNTERKVFYYSTGTSTSIDETSNSLFTVYPNPASNSVSFRWNGNYESLSLELYQITGVKAMEQIIYPSSEISVSRLENGIYFFRLLNGQQTLHAGKLIKK